MRAIRIRRLTSSFWERVVGRTTGRCGELELESRCRQTPDGDRRCRCDAPRDECGEVAASGRMGRSASWCWARLRGLRRLAFASVGDARRAAVIWWRAMRTSWPPWLRMRGRAALRYVGYRGGEPGRHGGSILSCWRMRSIRWAGWMWRSWRWVCWAIRREAERSFAEAGQILHTNFVAAGEPADVAGELLRAAAFGDAGGAVVRWRASAGGSRIMCMARRRRG